MGYDLELFLDNDRISPELICSICLGVMQDPLMVIKCEHMFCRQCINRVIARYPKTCPIDRTRIIGRSQMKPPSRPIINMLNDLTRKCKFGCTATFKLGDTKTHEERCVANPDIVHNCPCGAALKMAELQGHSCIDYLKEKLQAMEVELANLRQQVAEAYRGRHSIP